MTRSQLVQRIQSLSDADLARVAPYLEADLDALTDLDALREEVRQGRESAESEPLRDHADVRDAARRRTRNE